MLVGTLATQVLSPALMTKSSPGVPPVCWRVFALLFSSLSLSPDSHSVRPSVSQSAGQVWFGCRVQKKTHTSLNNTIFFCQHPLPCRLLTVFHCNVMFVSAQLKGNFSEYFSSLNFLVSDLLRSSQRKGEERGGRGL